MCRDIPDCESYIFRRIFPEHYIQDKKTLKYRISSQAYHHRKNEKNISIYVGRLIKENNETPLSVSDEKYGFKSAGTVGIEIQELQDPEYAIQETPSTSCPWHGQFTNRIEDSEAEFLVSVSNHWIKKPKDPDQ